MDWKDNIDKILKEERKEWGMSRKKLARLAHVDEDLIEDIETKKITNPDFYDMLSICDVLQTSVFFYILEEEKND